MLEIIWTIVKFAWPWILAASVWGVMEARLLVCHSSLNASLKRETVLQSSLDTAKKRSTDLALLYAGMLDKPEQARKAQEDADHVQIASLQQRVDQLSHAPTLHFSGLAAGLLDSVSSFANGGDAAPAAAPAGGAEAIPAVAVSEADVVEHDKQAAEAYRDAVNMFHECRNLYNDARSAQLTVTQ